MDPEIKERLQDVYRKLYRAYGSQHWWPGDGHFEMMVGAILTQSAAWTNVEKAIGNLKAAGALSPKAIREIETDRLAELVYPSGYFNAKARKLKALAEWLGKNCSDDPDKLLSMPVEELRKSLLDVWGVGEETADSILLYAAGKPVFVIDAYTRRIISRLGIAPEKDTYTACQKLFLENLPADVDLFNEFHALLVCLGKSICRKKPLCLECPLREGCKFFMSTV